MYIDFDDKLKKFFRARTGVTPQAAREELKKLHDQLDDLFMYHLYQHGVARGRDIEYRTNLDHNSGMKKLGGGASDNSSSSSAVVTDRGEGDE